ncbi:MAG: A/G-specific adenine glycosylase [Candidatus Sumerlaeia bacterium]|nr:A/G-specific adenine glycosylase [Candidatus Sumerlaeia bacterium]
MRTRAGWSASAAASSSATTSACTPAAEATNLRLPPDDQLPAFRAALLDWFDRGRRDLPWRATKDPYAIWVSEAMLQQTTVATVQSRWRAFIERFPTVRALADAPLDDVLAQWRGLGYYQRARNLHAAAQAVAKAGAFPRTADGWRALPGVGPYAAAAVASIAFDDPSAVVDANVKRVLARLAAREEPVEGTRAAKELAAAARRLLDGARPGDWNQAVMELGATVCSPRAPQCPRCPVAPWCKGLATGAPERFPAPSAKPAKDSRTDLAVAVRRGDRVLILRRPAEARHFGGMWELPRAAVDPALHHAREAARVLREVAGLEARSIGDAILTIRHTVMNSRIELRVCAAEADGEPAAPGHDEFRWATAGEWLALPSSSTQHRVAKALAGEGG